MEKVLVIHGPNMNLLGTREPHIYGTTTLEELNATLAQTAKAMGLKLVSIQSNHEGEIVQAIQEAGAYLGVVLNAAGYTHTSVAIRDAVAACPVPVVEVHMTNPAAREPFRQVSLLASVCAGTIAGFGIDSYILALMWLARTRKG